MTATSTPPTPSPVSAVSAGAVDVRAPRFGAAVTTVVLATAIVAGGRLGALLVAWQVAVFLVASVAGARRSPYGHLFRWTVRRFGLGPPPATEPAGPPRFAQACGAVVGGAGLVALVAGATLLGWALVTVVLVLSTLLAVGGICLGCELYVAGRRLAAAVGRRGERP